MRPSPVDTSFEALLKAFLAEHPAVSCEWRQVTQLVHSRTDVICGVGLPTEVFASFNRGGQITVGVTSDSHHEDFEDFGRRISDEKSRARRSTILSSCYVIRATWPMMRIPSAASASYQMRPNSVCSRRRSYGTRGGTRFARVHRAILLDPPQLKPVR